MQLPLPADALVPVGVGVLVTAVVVVALVLGLRTKAEESSTLTHADWTGEHVGDIARPAAPKVPTRTVAEAIAARRADTDPFPVVPPHAVLDHDGPAEPLEVDDIAPADAPPPRHAAPQASRPGDVPAQAQRPPEPPERSVTLPAPSTPPDLRTTTAPTPPEPTVTLPAPSGPVDPPTTPADRILFGPLPPEPDRSGDDRSTPASPAGSSHTMAAAVAHVLAARAAAPAATSAGPDRRSDARDRLLAVLLDDPLRAVGAAVDLVDCQDRMERLTGALAAERVKLGELLTSLASSGLKHDQLARLSGIPDADVTDLLRHPHDG